MKTRHVITIGILSAIAVALLGIAVALGKVNKPKTLQTNAYYEYTDISGTNTLNPNWTIEGQPTNYRISYDQNIGIPLQPIFHYTFRKVNSTIQLTQTITDIIWLDYEENPDVVRNYAIDPNYGGNREIRTLNNISKGVKTITGQLKQVKITGDNADLVYVQMYWYLNHYDDTQTFMPITFNFKIDNFCPADDLNGTYVVEEINTSLLTITTYGTQKYQQGALTAGDALEVIPVRNMMLEILTMPFTFINQAFNVTLWEGTAYAVNIGNFIKGIIAILAIIFIVKLFTSGFSTLGNYTNNYENKQLKRSQTRYYNAKAKEIEK